MQTEGEHKKQSVWPPAPTLESPSSTSRSKLPPLWVVIAINGGGSMLLSTFKIIQRRYTHQIVDWRADVESGLSIFVTTMAIQWGMRRRVRRREAEAAQE